MPLPQVYGLRQFRKAHGRVRRRRSTTGAVEPSARLPSNTGPLQPSPRQPARRRGPSHPEKAADSPRTKRQEEQGETGSGSSAGRRSRSPTTVAFGRSAEASGPLSGGGRSARSTEDETAAECEGQVARNQRMEVKAEMLQRALANMRKKARFDAVSYDIWASSSFAARPQRCRFVSRVRFLRISSIKLQCVRSVLIYPQACRAVTDDERAHTWCAFVGRNMGTVQKRPVVTSFCLGQSNTRKSHEVENTKL